MKDYDFTSQNARGAQAAFGAQDYLRFGLAVPPDSASAAWPSAGSGTYDMIQGERLIDIGAGIVPSLGVGTYYLSFALNGMAVPTVYVKLTFTGGTVNVNAFSTYKDHVTQKQAFTGNGAVTTATLATLSLPTPLGEEVGLVQIVVGTGATVTAATIGEFAGQRG